LLKSLPDYRPEIEREKSYFNRLLKDPLAATHHKRCRSQLKSR
jgi:hypothetical protein